jgi:hypothetical protein
MGSALDGVVLDFAIAQGDLIAAGRFRSAGGALAPGVARWSGGHWSPIGSGLGNEGWALASYAGGELAVAGPYSDPGGFYTSRVQRMSVNNWLPLGNGMVGNVHDLIAFNNGLVAAGSLTNASGTPVQRVAFWDGTAWSALGAPDHATVLALAVYNQELIAAGTRAGPAGAEYSVMRWDGQQWRAMGTLPNNEIRALAVHGGALIAAGSRLGTGNLEYPPVWRWNGQAWVALEGLDHTVSTLAVYNGDLFAAGSYPDGADTRVSRWDGLQWTPLPGDFDRGFATLYAHQGQLLASGNFSHAGDLVAPFIAAYGSAQTTQTVLSSLVANQVGDRAVLRIEVSADSAPLAGHVTVTGVPSGSCSDLQLVKMNATTSFVTCGITWRSACARALVADYSGGMLGATVWQPSRSNVVVDPVGGTPVCFQTDLFADGLE